MKIDTRKMILIALAVAINIVGSKISLFLHLPIYLDSIGTMLSAIALGPIAGGFTALVGGLINGALGDIFAIYFSISGVIMGVIAGLLFHKKNNTFPGILWKCLVVILPAAAVSACIETILFDGITSAVATTLIIKVLSTTALKLFGSAFVTQVVTDYVDKLIGIVLVLECLKRLPKDIIDFNAGSSQIKNTSPNKI